MSEFETKTPPPPPVPPPRPTRASVSTEKVNVINVNESPVNTPDVANPAKPPRKPTNFSPPRPAPPAKPASSAIAVTPTKVIPPPPKPSAVNNPVSNPAAATGTISKSVARPMTMIRKSILPADATVVLDGVLSKRNRDGKYDKCHVTLTNDSFGYYKLPMTSIEESKAPEMKFIALETVIVGPIQETDSVLPEKGNRTFRLYSQNKSFLLRGKTADIKDEWYTAIDSTAQLTRRAAGIKAPVEADLAPIWAVKETHCKICNIGFGLFTRKHHCRNCGICVCEACSKEKMRIPKIDPTALFKVCNPCGMQLKEHRVYGAASGATV